MNLPAWNIESEYPALSSSEFLADEKRFAEISKDLKGRIEKIRPEMKPAGANTAITDSLQQILLLNREATLLIHNLFTYVHCMESTDASNEEAKSKSSQLHALLSEYQQIFKPVDLFLTTCADEIFEKTLGHPDLKGGLFQWRQDRLMKDTLLSEQEETLLAALDPSGFSSWGELYSAISGTMKVQITLDGKTKEVGLAEASGMTRSSSEAERKAAWTGVQRAWKKEEESAAAILNSLAGWRLELVKRRSHTRPLNFLTQSLFNSRIQAETLDAMMKAVENNKADIQQAALIMAKMIGKKKLDPWDTLAPAPVQKKDGKTSFEDGIGFIRTAFAGVDSDFGNFVDMMVQNRWIEARVLPNKANGAYCTGFLKSKTPRVFQTYLGSNHDISTLAHELGHAYHAWVMRDLPFEEDYPMTLAETASIFAETVLTDVMIEKAKTKEEKIDFAWGHIESAVNLLLNIPARFEFEYQFYQKRKERKLSARELSEITDQAWTKWYGDTLTENDKMFWASKLHFSMARTSFYNYPYTFGYLFALSIYARRPALGKDFWPKYKEILRDTGRMTAEDLIQKHLGEDIRRPEFWQKSIDVVKSQIEAFKKLI